MDWTNKIILIIEDDIEMCELVATIFEREGATVHCAEDGETGLRWLYENRPHLIFLDLLLPGIDGNETMRTIRILTDVPLIILTAVTQREQLLQCLDNGADDVITKPFKVDELVARAWAIMRRAHTIPAQPDIYDDGYLVVDLNARSVEVRGERVKLTTTEFTLLACLISRTGMVCTFEQIQNSVWHNEFRGSANNIHLFIWQLRQKIEPDPKQPTYIISEHGIGYRITTDTPV